LHPGSELDRLPLPDGCAVAAHHFL
jgi:hypothetical protein